MRIELHDGVLVRTATRIPTLQCFTVNRDSGSTHEVGEAGRRRHGNHPGTRGVNAERIGLPRGQIDGTTGLESMHLLTRPGRDATLEDVEDLSFTMMNVQRRRIAVASRLIEQRDRSAVWDPSKTRSKTVDPAHSNFDREPGRLTVADAPDLKSLSTIPVPDAAAANRSGGHLT